MRYYITLRDLRFFFARYKLGFTDRGLFYTSCCDPKDISNTNYFSDIFSLTGVAKHLRENLMKNVVTENYISHILISLWS